jgi:hypothetical protein
MKTHMRAILCVTAMILSQSCGFVIGTRGGGGSTAVYPVPDASSAKRVFDVGPDYAYREIAEVPWLALKSGDLVRIHYRQEPYRGIVGIRAIGTAGAPIRIYGVPSPAGELPTITGSGAVAGANLSGFFDQWTSGLGVFVITGSWNSKPAFIEIVNLKITGAVEGSSYTDETGSHPWADGSCGIWLKAGNVSVKGCEIYGNNEGILTQANYESIDNISSDFLLEGCRIYGNGMVGSDRFHNLYIQSAGMTVQFCYIGTLRPGAGGSSLKDRSSGTVIRYNMIEAGARLLDLVEPEDTYDVLSARDDFRATYVYGNLLINESSAVNGGCGSLVHYGADNDETKARDGTLYFYGNTVYSNVDQSVNWSCNLFECESERARIVCCDDVFGLSGNAEYYLLRERGELHAAGGNWISAGWEVHGSGVGPFGSLAEDSPLIQGAAPGFANPAKRDFRLNAASQARSLAVGLPTELANGHPLEYQYEDGRVFSPRPSLADPGAVSR